MPPHPTRPCAYCGRDFPPNKPSVRFCSRRCRFDQMGVLTMERLMAKVDSSTGCWLWTGTKNPKGYGIIVVQRRSMTAHRASWTLHRGPIPAGMSVLHNCPTGDNTACVNPSHLWLGTQHQNVADMVAKNRQASGARSGAAQHPASMSRPGRRPYSKLTEAEVREIRALHATGAWTYSQLGARFDIGAANIWPIVKGKTWKDVV